MHWERGMVAQSLSLVKPFKLVYPYIGGATTLGTMALSIMTLRIVSIMRLKIIMNNSDTPHNHRELFC